MNPTIKNILAVLAGIIIGGIVNMGIIMISGYVIPPPEGVDMTTAEGIKAAVDADVLQSKHYIMPFLAHALGVLVGAVVATLLGASHKFRLAMVIGVFFLIGGIMAANMIPAPTWFIVLDLVMAYIPMAWLGYKLVTRKK